MQNAKQNELTRCEAHNHYVCDRCFNANMKAKYGKRFVVYSAKGQTSAGVEASFDNAKEALTLANQLVNAWVWDCVERKYA